MKSNKRSLIYADVACRNLEVWLNSKKYEYEQGVISSEYVEFIVKVRDNNINVWFSVDKQVYGFKTTDNVLKTCSKFSMFCVTFETYMEINEKYIPVSKKISLQFEELFGVKTIYDKFTGTKFNGFVFLYRVLDDDTLGIRIRYINPSLYRAELVKYKGNENDFDVKETRIFKVANGNVEMVRDKVTLASVIERGLTKNFSYNPRKKELVYTDKLNHLIFKETKEGIRLDNSNSGLRKTKGVLLNSKTADDLVAEALSTNCWDYIPIYSVLGNYLTKDNELIVGDKVFPLTSRGNTLVICDGEKRIDINDVSLLELFIQSYQPAQSIEELKEDIKDESEDKCMEGNVVIKKVVSNEEVVAVRFIDDTGIFDIPTELMTRLSIPLDRLVLDSKMYERNGILITDDELNRKTFSKCLSEKDMEVIEKLVSSIFN